MRIPTFDNLRAGARDSLARFPFVLLAALVTAVAGCLIVENDDPWGWLRILLSAQLGIALMFAIDVKAESNERLRPLRFVGVGVGAGALVVYGLTLPDVFTTVAITRHIQFTLGLHLLVAFTPFAGAGRLNGFWQYNRSLFLRFCLAAVYSAVLFGGLSIALVAIDQLLGVAIEGTVYARMMVIIATVFNTWMFVAGVPRDILGLEDSTEYTAGLRVFAQYILTPLVTIYLVILTIYLGKIVVTRVWPSGWIGYLVSSVAVAGILAHLLVFPMRNDPESQWVRNYSRWYYAGMIPAVVMLLMAIGKRIDQYGVTEMRYILAVLAVWLAVMSVYFVVSRVKNIKLIPITLCGLAFVTSFGPWGAFAVSKRSQMNRLTGLLESNQILVDGSIQAAPDEVSFEDRKEISAVLDYIVGTHGGDEIAPWFGDRWAQIDTFAVDERRDNTRQVKNALIHGIMTEMNIDYVSRWKQPLEEGGDFYVSVDEWPTAVPLEGADVMVRIEARMEPVTLDGAGRSVSWDADRQAFVIRADGDDLAVEMDEWIDELMADRTGPARQGMLTIEQSRVDRENDHAHATIFVRTVRGRSLDKGVTVHDLYGICLIRWKD